MLRAMLTLACLIVAIVCIVVVVIGFANGNPSVAPGIVLIIDALVLAVLGRPERESRETRR